jgi:hypothetical protein
MDAIAMCEDVERRRMYQKLPQQYDRTTAQHAAAQHATCIECWLTLATQNARNAALLYTDTLGCVARVCEAKDGWCQVKRFTQKQVELAPLTALRK